MLQACWLTNAFAIASTCIVWAKKLIPCGMREQTTCQRCPKMLKNVSILKFRDHIWNHHEKWIQISTNIPGYICSLIREIHTNIPEIWESKVTFTQCQCPPSKSLKKTQYVNFQLLTLDVCRPCPLWVITMMYGVGGTIVITQAKIMIFLIQILLH